MSPVGRELQQPLRERVDRRAPRRRGPLPEGGGERLRAEPERGLRRGFLFGPRRRRPAPERPRGLLRGLQDAQRGPSHARLVLGPRRRDLLLERGEERARRRGLGPSSSSSPSSSPSSPSLLPLPQLLEPPRGLLAVDDGGGGCGGGCGGLLLRLGGPGRGRGGRKRERDEREDRGRVVAAALDAAARLAEGGQGLRGARAAGRKRHDEAAKHGGVFLDGPADFPLGDGGRGERRRSALLFLLLLPL